SPITCRTRAGWRNASIPATCRLPASGRSRVATARMKVVLPAPLGPSRATTRPGSATRSSPARAGVRPKRLVRPRASRIGVTGVLSWRNANSGRPRVREGVRAAPLRRTRGVTGRRYAGLPPRPAGRSCPCRGRGSPERLAGLHDRTRAAYEATAPRCVTSAGFTSTLLCRRVTEEGNDDGRARLAGGALPGAPPPPAGGGLPDARLAHRGRRCRPGNLAAAQPQPHRHQRGPQPGRLADDAGRAGVPGHAARAHRTARGTPGRAPARPGRQPPGRGRPRAARLAR